MFYKDILYDDVFNLNVVESWKIGNATQNTTNILKFN